MKTRLSIISLATVFAFLLASCGGSDVSQSGGASTTTGWEYNSPDNGGFEVVQQYDQETGPGLVFIEGGTFTMGRVEQDLMYDWNNVPRRVTVTSFYMDETEIRNVDYREYVYWLKRVFVDNPEISQNALPDTLVWRSPLAFNEPYVEYYYRHPSYNEYPVVGVNWLQASDYCIWRTDRVNEKTLIDEGILEPDPNQLNEENFNTEAYLAGQYTGLVRQNLPSLTNDGAERIVRLEDGIMLPRYRLPTEAEWEFAAVALIGNSYDERVYERRIYPWNGHNLRQDDKKARGEMRANFVRGRGDYMGTAGDLNDNGAITVPVKSYWPNDYGLYCMAGNVSEWVADVYRPLSAEDVNEFRPFRGNVFTEVARNPDGSIASKDSMGRLKRVEMTEERIGDRQNFSKSDYRNYSDGDINSSLDFVQKETAGQDGSGRMYAQKGSDMSSLVNDETRVYKGGSWKDRAYWLSPGTRRFLHQEEAREDIGFRCAMIRVGSPAGY